MSTQDSNLLQLIARVEKLEKAVFGDKKTSSTQGIKKNEGIDFSQNIRAFTKRYASDKSGPKKFTLLLAYLTKGEIGKDVNLNEVMNCWNKMTSKNLLGKFNRFYPNDAKTRGWVDSRKYGAYCLTKEWENTL